MIDTDDSSLGDREGIRADAEQRAEAALQAYEEPASLTHIRGQLTELVVWSALPCQPALGRIISTLGLQHALSAQAKFSNDHADQTRLGWNGIGRILTAGVARLQSGIITQTR